MNDKAKRSKLKDLDPKDRAKDVNGGIVCCLLYAAGAGYRVADGAIVTVRRTVNPR